MSILNFFNPKRNLRPAYSKKPSDFKVGEVYKMEVASRSHVKSPYYVIIEDVGKDFIITNIPDEHSLKITYDADSWDYHIPIMSLIAGDSAKKLIYNQKNLMPKLKTTIKTKPNEIYRI